ncbi:MAG: ribosome-associated translation inhibitor RaiA [Bacteroidales bacterium]|nr:ribosome-associated translation inhibitor RaiA [Bacteroidales bacterium]
MNININSVHFKTDVKLDNFIEKKLQKLSVMHEGVVGSDVILRVDNSETRENKVAEIKLMLRGEELFAKKQSKTFEEATDLAVDALKKQIEKHKERFKK